MPSDFGDESGEKLFDWMVRVGQEAGQAAMSHGAARVSMAFRNSVGEIGREGAALANPQQPETAPEWAKLNLHEFKELPEFETIKKSSTGSSTEKHCSTSSTTKARSRS